MKKMLMSVNWRLAQREREDSSTSSVTNAILVNAIEIMTEPEDKAEVADVLVTDEEVSVCEDKIEKDHEETVTFGDDVSNIARSFNSFSMLAQCLRLAIFLLRESSF
jgi:hypothetical protein